MKILGNSVATARQMATYLKSLNDSPKFSIDISVEDFCQLYLDVCGQEGVRGDLAFAQACKETGNFRFRGDVMYTQNNFCGLGATGGVIGCVFDTIAEGILAHAQHLKTYATKDNLTMPCVDPRRTAWFVKAKAGTSPDVETLGGTWAVPGYDTKKYQSLNDANKARDSYGYQIVDILNRIISIKKGGDNMAIKKKVCLDAGHYGKYNRSPVVPEYYESDMVWKLHLMLKNYLEQLGIEVITTRADKNKDLALVSRGMASKGCDLFLSLHSNACGSESVNYAAIYHLVNDVTTDVDDLSKDFANKIAPVIGNVMGVGYKVLSRAAQSDRNKDGMKNDNYYGVLHGARMAGTPGLILEHSFHTNRNATLWLLQDENLDKLAQAEAKCIAEWLTGSTPTPIPIPTPTTNLVAKGFEYAAKFTGVNETSLSKTKARTLQHALNLDYGNSIDEDGMFGPKSKAKLGSHYVKKAKNNTW